MLLLPAVACSARATLEQLKAKRERARGAWLSEKKRKYETREDAGRQEFSVDPHFSNAFHQRRRKQKLVGSVTNTGARKDTRKNNVYTQPAVKRAHLFPSLPAPSLQHVSAISPSAN